MSTNTGFTIPELIIAMTVSAILLGMLYGPLDDLYRSSSNGLRSIVQVTNTRSALRQIEHNIELSDKFLPTNYGNSSSSDDIQDWVNTGKPVWNWAGSSSNSRVLVTQNYGTDSSGNIVLTKNDCDVTAPQIIEYAYFLQGTSLYRRTLTLKTYPSNCYGAVANKRTCPAAKTLPSGCQGPDALIATGVTNFSIDYYASSSSTTPLDNACGTGGDYGKHTCYSNSFGNPSTIPGQASSIVISITIQTGTGSNTITTTSQMRITRKNGVIS